MKSDFVVFASFWCGLAVVLSLLKIFDVISCTWILVLLPIWGWIVLIGAMLLSITIIVLVEGACLWIKNAIKRKS